MSTRLQEKWITNSGDPAAILSQCRRVLAVAQSAVKLTREHVATIIGTECEFCPTLPFMTKKTKKNRAPEIASADVDTTEENSSAALLQLR
jgi:hypothetical protein